MQEAALETTTTAEPAVPPARSRRAFPLGLLLRGTVVALCAFAVCWAGARAFFLPLSQQAVLSAPLIEIRAPIDGRIQLGVSRIGQRADRGVQFARIVNELEDDAELSRIERQLSELRASLESSTQLERQLSQARERFVHSARRFRSSKTDELSTGVSEGVALLGEAQLQRDKKLQVLARVRPQVDAGVSSAAELEAAQSEVAIAEGAVATARARLEHSQAILRAAVSGAFLAGSDGGASYVQQRNDALDLQLADQSLRSDMLRLQAQALEQQRVRAAENLAAKREQSLKVQQAGRLWELHVADGAFVSKGQVLARVVNCEQMLITASVSNHTFARLSLGDTASFQSHDKRRRFQGVVRQLLGPMAWNAPVAIQVPLGAEVKGEKDARSGVVLEIDAKAADCRVGEAGEVAFGSGLWVTVNQLLSLPF